MSFLRSKFVRGVLLWFLAACLFRVGYEFRQRQDTPVVLPAIIGSVALGCAAAFRGWNLFEQWRKQ
jgi:hypothetical protein